MNFSIKTRIISGFGAVTILALSTGIVGAALLNDIRHTAEGYGKAADISDQTRDTEAAVTLIKVPVNQWLRSGAANFAKMADGNIESLAGDLRKLSQESLSSSQQQTIAALVEAEQGYKAHWQGMLDRAEKLRVLSDKIDGLAQQARSSLPLSPEALSFEVADNDFQRFRASQKPELLSSAVARLDAVIAAAPKQADILGAYRAAIVDCANQLNERTTYLSDFTKNGTALTDGTAKLRSDAGAIATSARAALEATIATTLWTLVSAASVLAVIAIVVSLGVAGAVLRPLNRLTVAVRRLADGDLQHPVPDTDRSDEFGTVAAAVDVFRHALSAADSLRRDQEAMTHRLAKDRKTYMNNLADTFETRVMDVVKAVASSSVALQTTAQSMSTGASNASAQATAVAAAAEQATVNVQTVASAAEELSASITEISRQVTESTRISAVASEEMVRTNAMVQGLSAAADRIGDVVKLINDIASQTNLLALNATIEAARAGDAGKGFAVVAGEVKNLANQTGRATDEIGQQITSVQEETRRTVEAIKGITTVINQVREISSGIAAAVEEQGAATREIARNVQQAAQGTNDVSDNIGGVTQSARTTGAAAEEVLGSANGLSTNSEKLRGEVTRFLTEVRSA